MTNRILGVTDASSESSDSIDTLRAHGIAQHAIVLSMDEVSRGNLFYKYLLEFRVLDMRVVMINQIMYTFHRRPMYVIESMTRETWYWSTQTFKDLNPLMKYDFNDNWKIMIITQVAMKIFKLLGVLVVFASISVTNALFIRICIKSSILLVFPMLLVSNRMQN